VIVSMPKIAATATSTTALVSGSALSGKFADVLSSAAGDVSALVPEKTDVGMIGMSSKLNAISKAGAKSGTKSSKVDVANSKLDVPIASVPQSAQDNLKLPIGVPALAHLTTPRQEQSEGDPEPGSGDKAQPVTTLTPPAEHASTAAAFTAVPFFGMSTLAFVSTVPAQTCEPMQAKLPAASESSPPAHTEEKTLSPSTANLPKAEAVTPIEHAKTPANAAITVPAEVTPHSNSTQASGANAVVKDGERSGEVPEKHVSGTRSEPQADKPETSALSAAPAVSAVETIKSTTTQALPLTTTGRNVASQSDSGIVPPSSQWLKKDGDAAKNPPPSDKINPAPTVHSTAESASTSNSVSSPASTNNAAAPLITSAATKVASSTPPSKPADAAQPSAQVSTAMAKADASAEVATHTGPVQVAKLIERAGQTELRVGIQAGEFGNVGIRTSMVHSQFSAEISVERGELGRVLSAELPALRDRLAEQRVPVSNIVLQDHSTGSDLRQGARQNHYLPQNNPLGSEQADATTPAFAVENSDSETGLDVHM